MGADQDSRPRLRRLKWVFVVRGAGLVMLSQQLVEWAVYGVSLAEHPGLVIAAVGLLTIPVKS